MHDTILSLFSVPILHGHIDPPVGLVEEITSKYNDCNRGVWSSETGYSTGELGMFLHEESPILGKLVESMMPSVIEYWDNHPNLSITDYFIWEAENLVSRLDSNLEDVLRNQLGDDLTIDVNVDDKSLILKKIINNFYNIK